MSVDDELPAEYKNRSIVPNKRTKASLAPSNDSPEEIERKRAERREKRLREIQEDNQPIDHTASIEQLGFRPRRFVSFDGNGLRGGRIRILTFNILAQGLVKRELFPGSDLLKWHQRGPILMREVCYHNPDIACLVRLILYHLRKTSQYIQQEVDRLNDHAPTLKKAGYDMRWETGYFDKVHGLLIAWKSTIFKKEGERVALTDDLAFSSESDRFDGQKGKKRTGLTRVTRNVGLALALSCLDEPSRGIIVATHHLFWHARHTHERARQTGLWLREVRQFRRSKPEWQRWPLVFTGDFNTQPFEPTYRLLLGKPLLPRHRAMLAHSRVVHFTVDLLNRDNCSFPFGGAKPLQRDEEEAEVEAPVYTDESGDSDQTLKACRAARETDQLLTDEEIASLYADPSTGRPLALESAYGSHYGRLRKTAEAVECFDGRPPDEGVSADMFDGRTGADEPRWTSITPLWRCTLDYLFTLPGEGDGASSLEVTGLLPLHKTHECEPGLPRKGIAGSDHMALMAEYAFTTAKDSD